jgi:hypothetical protein
MITIHKKLNTLSLRRLDDFTEHVLVLYINFCVTYNLWREARGEILFCLCLELCPLPRHRLQLAIVTNRSSRRAPGVLQIEEQSSRFTRTMRGLACAAQLSALPSSYCISHPCLPTALLLRQPNAAAHVRQVEDTIQVGTKNITAPVPSVHLGVKTRGGTMSVQEHSHLLPHTKNSQSCGVVCA